MHKAMKEIRSRRDEGFTLIELLVVIVVLGILAAVVVFAAAGITDRGKKSSCETEVSIIATALESVNARDGQYPAVAANGTAAATVNTLNEALYPEDQALRLISQPMSADSPSIQAGYRYRTLGNYAGGTCAN